MCRKGEPVAGRATKKRGAGTKAGAKKAPARATHKKSPDRSKRARATKPASKPAAKKTPIKKQTIKQAAAALSKALTSPDTPLASPPPRRGRPKNTPDLWTPEHIEEVAEAFWAYVELTPCPLLAEFCYAQGVHRQRIYEFPELAEIKDMLYAKRAAYLDQAGLRLTRDDGPRGAYLIRASANLGEHSMTEKTENAERVTAVNVYIPDNQRGDGPKLEAAGG